MSRSRTRQRQPLTSSSSAVCAITAGSCLASADIVGRDGLLEAPAGSAGGDFDAADALTGLSLLLDRLTLALVMTTGATAADARPALVSSSSTSAGVLRDLDDLLPVEVVDPFLFSCGCSADDIDAIELLEREVGL